MAIFLNCYDFNCFFNIKYYRLHPVILYELSKNNLLDFNNLNVDKIKKCLYENIDYIEKSTNKYLY